MRGHVTPFRQQLGPDRLCEAADAALRAVTAHESAGGARNAYPADLMGGAVRPACLDQFTLWEVEQACEFLVRLGMLDRPKARAKKL